MATTPPQLVTPTMNNTLLKKVSRSALINEIIEKTKRCGFIWTQIEPAQFTVANLPYDFYLTRSNQNVITLDVWKNAAFYRTYNSYTQPEVRDLWDCVDLLMSRAQQFERTQDAMQFLSRVPRCSEILSNVFNEVMSGGVVGNGTSEVFTVIITNQFTLLPTSMTTNTNSIGTVNFTGVVSNIADAPDVTHNDGDTTTVVMNYNGLNHNQSYQPFFKIFVNTALIPLGVYSVIRTRLVLRLKSSTDGMTVATDYAINDANNASGLGVNVMTNVPSTFVTIDDGFVPLPLALTNAEITSLAIFVYVTAQSYTADPSLTELILTAADITVGSVTEF